MIPFPVFAVAFVIFSIAVITAFWAAGQAENRKQEALAEREKALHVKRQYAKTLRNCTRSYDRLLARYEAVEGELDEYRKRQGAALQVPASEEGESYVKKAIRYEQQPAHDVRRYQWVYHIPMNGQYRFERPCMVQDIKTELAMGLGSMLLENDHVRYRSVTHENEEAHAHNEVRLLASFDVLPAPRDGEPFKKALATHVPHVVD